MLPGYELPQRTRLICQILKWSTLFIVALLVYFYFEYGAVDKISGHFWDELSQEAQAAVVVTKSKTIAISVLATLSWFAPLALLLGVWRMLAAFQAGDVFSLRAVRSIRFMGIMVILETTYRVLLPSAMIGLMTFDSLKGHCTFTVSITSNQMIQLLVGALFLLIGYIFTQAVHMSDENRQIV